MALKICKDCGKEISTKAKICPNCGARVKKSRGFLKFLGVIVLFFVFLGLIGHLIEEDSTEKKTDRFSRDPKEKIKKERRKPIVQPEKLIMPKYSVLDEDIHDSPIKAQVVLNILVSGEVSEAGLSALLNKLYFSAKAKRGFKYHKLPTNIYIYAFTSKERAESGMGQWVAMLALSYGDAKPSISINNRQIAQLDAKPEEKFGLSEATRKQIWGEIVISEDRATKEAEERYPLDPTQSLRVGQVFEISKETPLMPELEAPDIDQFDEVIATMRKLPPRATIKVLKVAMKRQTPWYFVEARSSSRTLLGKGWINSIALIGQDQSSARKRIEEQIDLERKLNDKYKNELTKKYGLTLEQLKEIGLEGVTKDWPFPK